MMMLLLLSSVSEFLFLFVDVEVGWFVSVIVIVSSKAEPIDFVSRADSLASILINNSIIFGC